MQQSNQEEVANGRGPARAEEDRGTGQGTSGVVQSFFFLVLFRKRSSRKKTVSRGDLGQHRPEKFSSRFWIRRGAISCSPHTSLDEIHDSVVNSERGELVRGSDPPLGVLRSLLGR